MSTALREVIHLQNLLLDVTSQFPSRNLKWFVVLSKTMLVVLRLPNRTTRFAPGPNTFQYGCFTFVIMLKRGLSQLSMSRLPIFLQKPLPRDQYIRLRHQIMGWTSTPRGSVKLLWDRYLNNVSQLPFPSSQNCLEQYCTFYSTSNRFHLSFVYFI